MSSTDDGSMSALVILDGRVVDGLNAALLPLLYAFVAIVAPGAV